MEFLKIQFTRIQQQLGGLSASQKMLTGTLLALMVITLLWWARYAGEAEMSPVLDQPLAAEDLTRITAMLRSQNIAYKTNGDRVLVPTERRFEALASLGYAQLLPKNNEDGFNQIVKQHISPWNTNAQNEVLWNQAKQITLGQVIGAFPGVASARVLIDPTYRRGIGDTSVFPSATVNITMRGGDNPGKQLIEASADLVAGAVSTLPRKRISVIVDGRPYPVRDRDGNSGLGSGELLETQLAWQRHHEEQILRILSHIRNVMVSVNVQVNTVSREAESRNYDPTRKVQMEKSVNEREEENNAGGNGPAEPGAVPNTTAANQGLDVASAGESSASTARESRTEFENYPSVIVEKSRTPAGVAMVSGAAVRIPRSYFVEWHRRAHPDVAAEPSDADLQPLVDRELATIRTQVQTCTAITDVKNISVETYVDAFPDLAMATQTLAGGPAGMPLSVTSHAREIAIGILALVSLFMVTLMVRKSAPLPAVALAMEHKPEPARLVTSGEDVAGEATEGNSLLDGMELDDDMVKTQQMLGQVQQLVKENPDTAANLVKRWLNK